MTSVAAGSRLGPYEVLSRIGAGGMGEVFRARDTRLDRTVAIKILPAAFASNAQLKIRFEREAKAISQISHPHICALYDVGQAEGVEYIVLELLEGETLAERIARGPLPIADVLRIGSQIASALACAHRAGIVHRDLKPGNVMITRSGAKLLDFGLARSAPGLSTPTDATQHKPLTQEGTILGTFLYIPSNWPAKRSTREATSSPSARCSTRCSPARAPSRESRGRASSPRCSPVRRAPHRVCAP